MVELVFDPGDDTAEITDQITGPEAVIHRFEGKPGQQLPVRLVLDNQTTEFLLYAPGEWSGEEIYDSQTGGSREYRGELYLHGMHTVQVFQTGRPDADQTSTFDRVITKR